jgi:hypothetical protein
LRAAAVLLVLVPAFAAAQGHREVDIFSTSDGSGELTLDLGAGGPTIPVFESLCAGGECLYSTVEIGIVSPDVDVPEESLFALDTGARVSLEVVAIDAAVTVKLGQQVADEAGDVLDFGIAPGIHVHPEWQVVAPEGVEGDFPLSVRLRAQQPTPYIESQVIDLLLSNRAGPPPVETVGPIEALAIQQPRARGDQIVFYYDTREGFTSFLNVANEGEAELDIELTFYGPLLDAPFELVIEVPARGSRTIDLATLRSSGLAAQTGIAFATTVNESGRSVTTGALAGNFTVANLTTNSAWGGPAPARSAFQLPDGGPPVQPPFGTTIDGQTVFLEQFSPSAVDLAVYYDPATLEPPAAGGNQVISASFDDVVATNFAAVARSATWAVNATRNDGQALPASSRSLSGVQVLDLESLVGSDVDGSAGRLGLTLESASAPNRIVFFQESLGTFATGYRLPAVAPNGLAATTRPTRGLSEPMARGDQLILYYDGRPGFTAFLNMANEGDAALNVLVQLYPSSLGAPFEINATLAARGTRTFDVGALQSQGMPAGAGIALVTAVDAEGGAVTSAALAGSFTVANLGTLSAWGAPAAARAAVELDGGQYVVNGTAGEPIDGTSLVFDQISPRTLDLSVYYDPDTLEPAASGGNQLVFVSFDDVAGNALSVVPGEVAWGFAGTRSDGTTTTAGTHTTTGVEVTDLESVAGTDLGGSAGRLRFSLRPPGAANRIIYFVESLGTFATGYALPAEE